VSRRKTVVDLHGIPKLDRCFLKLGVFQVSFTSADVIRFSFFLIGAAGQSKKADED
jgi:hypothetical protein